MNKTLILGLFAFILTLSAASVASAYGADPYDGVNRMGTYYQQQRTVYYNYETRYAYDYVAPPRAGGWFGTGTEWIVGLRSPQYTPVPPVHYANYYQPACGWPCWTGGYGYPRARASDFPYRSRLGGIYSY